MDGCIDWEFRQRERERETRVNMPMWKDVHKKGQASWWE